jgi:diguanylate cyclase (GGDEF)-like protein
MSDAEGSENGGEDAERAEDAAASVASDSGESDRHLACTLSAGILRQVRTVAGQRALPELLELAGSQRTLEFLGDNNNWISVDEAIALFEAAKQVTGDPTIPRRVGENAVRQYAGTQVATVLRSLGSPEELLRQITVVAGKFSTVSYMEIVELAPGHARIKRWTQAGQPNAACLCEWVTGLLSVAPTLYGAPPAGVRETACTSHGAAACMFELSWDDATAARVANPEEHITALEAQLVALNDRFESMYWAAGDLIADDDLASTLEKITERSTTAVRAQRYLLVVRPEPEAELEIHHRGFDDAEARGMAEEVLNADAADLPAAWLLADIRSHNHYYGRLLALFDQDAMVFAHERQALEHYARYAANALDRSIALAGARRANEHTTALLDFARSLAGADSSTEVARRLAEAVPLLVDCDRVAVFLNHEGTDRLTCRATHGYPPELDAKMRGLRLARGETDPEMAEELFNAATARALFFDEDSPSGFVQEMVRTFGSAAIVYVPIIARDKVLGVLSVSVSNNAARLRESRELNDRLSGIVAQAAVGLENGELIDRISHQARHDALTGLANRSFFAERFRRALDDAREDGRPLGLFFVDLDNFKHINDEFGHATGDELLRQVSQRLLGTVRALDTVARLGGDEFAIVLSQATRLSEVDAAAARVMHAFDDPFVVGGHVLEVRASVGRALWPDDAEELEELMHHADAAMYRAKRSARTLR